MKLNNKTKKDKAKLHKLQMLSEKAIFFTNFQNIIRVNAPMDLGY